MPNQKMKSLTLHLLAILLVGSLHNSNSNNVWPRAAVSATSSATTASATPTAAPTMTTLQPPSLPKPQSRTLPTTAMMASSTSATATTPATTIFGRRTSPHADVAASSLASTQLVRSASTAAGSVRQNRSFQSGGGVVASLQRSDNNVADSLKPSRQQRRQQQQHQPSFRPNQLTTTTSSPPPSPTAQTSSRSPEPPSFATTATHRLSKQQQQHEQQQQQQQHRQLRTTKTPRMIQRLVAGHIQNAEGHSTYQVSSVTTNSSVSHSMTSSSSASTTTSAASTTTPKPASTFFRRKSAQSSTYRHSKVEGSTPKPTTRRQATTTAAPVRLQTILDIAEDRDDDDEALLDDEAGDFDNWDHGILRLSAGSGKENTKPSKKKQDDSKKTLSDQVRDGKYGLIEKELFRRVPKRPGVLSYLPNKEVPVDNERTYGGLQEEDIWLAEDHLLVIKGGGLNEGERNEPWPPIDDYDAPERQIKIPPNPKVPPPFPVQLEANGPLQFIGNSKFTVVYPVANESVPVYPAGPTAAHVAPAGDGDDAQDLPARPGPAADAGAGDGDGQEEPGYGYPPPFPPWLYHNQTFVNPVLNSARPITFPGLGPFPFGRNASGSLDGADNNNNTVPDYFDEDDPSLYYPPAYSFVYKNNYSNPVPPGPLVPGIVLPPPPDHFSRLEKPAKTSSRHRGHPATTPTTSTSTTSTTTTTTTSTTTTTKAPTTTTSTTTTTTTSAPYRQVLTKITEYTPKTITITSPTSPPSPRPSPVAIEPIPVPVAVPVPIYPSKHFSSARPALVSFVPTTPEPAVETFSKSNPIYYEYFEAKRQPTTAANAIEGDFGSTTPKPRTGGAKPVKLYATSKRPFKTPQQHHRNYLQQLPPNRQFVQENVVYITPKPEIRYKAPAPAHPPPLQSPVFKQRQPLDSFEREVNAIRQTLRFYQNQQLRDNNIPRTPKAKPIYEYSFDAAKNLAPSSGVGSGSRPSFQPPAEYDEEPFKPMVTYSPPVDDENAFRAIAYDKVDNNQVQIQQPQQRQPKYQSTTTLIPVQPASAQYPDLQGRSKKLRLGGAKYIEQQQEYPGDYQSTPRTVLTTQPPWVSLDKQVIDEYQEQPQARHQAERLQLAAPGGGSPKNRGFNGYYYGSPQQPQPAQPQGRQNHRFYDEPFQNPVRKIVNYRPQQQLPLPPQQQQQQQQQPIWSLENDTYVNFAPNRPPLNPDAEFINPYQGLPLNPYQGQRYNPPPALSHQSQYYGPPPQRFPTRQQQPQQQQIPLHRDILVNYRQPLPPINPESEFISHPQVVRNQGNPVYRPAAYRLPASPQPPLEPANVYYIKPQYRRGVNTNNNNGNRQ